MQNELEVINIVKGLTSLEMGALTSKDLQTASSVLCSQLQRYKETAASCCLWGLLSKYSLHLLGKVR